MIRRRFSSGCKPHPAIAPGVSGTGFGDSIFNYFRPHSGEHRLSILSPKLQIKYTVPETCPGVYKRAGREFEGHGTVNHSIKEYVRGSFFHTNTVENYFSIFKRGVTGNYQWVSAKHLKRYLGEFDFRYNTRDVTDFERAALAAKGIVGKRLTYRRTNAG